MTTAVTEQQNKTNTVLAIAVRAIPQFLDPSISDLEKYRIELSADVTSHCRREGLLTSTEFVCYGAAYFPNFSKLIPHVFDNNGLTHLSGESGVSHDRPLVLVAVDENLRQVFLAITEQHHPLLRHQRAFSDATA